MLGAKRRRIIIGALFVVSFSSLAYQVLWLRLLIKIFGSNVYAVSTLLTSFMGGLAVGSYVGGYYVDKHGRAYDVYGKLLFSIGVVGFTTYYGFEPINIASDYLFESIKQTFLYHELQFILAFMLMFLPTTLLGAVYPVVNKLLVEDVGEDVGLIYGAENLAAGAGSIITGFFLISLLGIRNSINFISLTVMVVGLIVIYGVGTKK